ncbi:malto-oligosyltrehalose trehalohydrolase [Arenibaculum pallidiluteum]|uniref:malto-oligosyltrehalose trehalohydrolase n=1 Tax=Arenibaculum pallidiluteum TaxID=2812559 RepID=UPI001A95BBFC|nr:malto-oligosyltrehalose trehalohydrolase [Arenibaculum pallidiluteum]
MARFAHTMPFGAEIGDGGVRFRLWAPSAADVRLVVEGGPELPMERLDGGWHELTTDAARAGSRYAFRLPDGLQVPDPASRFQQDDVHGFSTVVDPRSYEWRNTAWKGRPWNETVLYELHVGTFSPEGTYEGLLRRLDHLAETGVTAVELLPLAECPGRRNWGYDGVMLFAPEAAYGRPEELKALVDAAHERGLMVFIDVVYNHFGPEGNYLHAYAGSFFTERHHTPWGAAINFDGSDARPVRDFYINNALYWLNEYRFDGIRFDAVHAIIDDSKPHILFELAERVRAEAQAQGREIHLVLENAANESRFLGRDQGGALRYDGQWNDDYHHAAHVLLTGESGGYYADFAAEPLRMLGRSLAEGYIFQGEKSEFEGHPRGEPSTHLPPAAMVNFLQNHDQIGNRAFGDRLATLAPEEGLRALLAVTLLAPQTPMLFMGEEWGARTPFQFFVDFHGELADAVREGRRKEFGSFKEFQDPEMRARIPDPNADETFQRSHLDWSEKDKPENARMLSFVRGLLRLRAGDMAPVLARAMPGGRYRLWDRSGLAVEWPLQGGGTLRLLANLGDAPISDAERSGGRALFETHAGSRAEGQLPAWSAGFHLVD